MNTVVNILVDIFGLIIGFSGGFLVCYLWVEKEREETREEMRKAMNESAEMQELCEEGEEEFVCDNNGDCEHCEWTTCPEMEGAGNGKF